MLRHYLLTAMRNIVRSKGYSFIKVAGLAVGLALCFLILLWVRNEFSYDQFHQKKDQIYRICQYANFGNFQLRTPIMMFPAGPALAQEYPEVIDAVRIESYGRVPVKYEDKIFYGDIILADNSIFSIFTFPMISGNPREALTAPNTVVITEDIVRKYFGDKDPIGQTLRLINEADYTVTGVIENVPDNSHLNFDMITSLQTRYSAEPEVMESWSNMGLYTYLLLRKDVDYQALEAKFPALIDEHLGASLKEFEGTTEFFLQPLDDVHLYSNLQFEPSTKGNINFVYLMSILALIVLIIACINFVNLSTAQSITKAREVGIRKTLGAGKKELMRQYMGETVIYSILATILAVIIVEATLPIFNNLMERELSLGILEQPSSLLFLGGFAILVGLLTGLYPAIVISSFRPVRILNSFNGFGSAKFNLRNILTVIQFALSIAFIIGTVIIYQQLSYLKTKNLGFNDEHVIVCPVMNESMQKSIDVFKEELSAVPGVISITAASNVPGKSINIRKYFPEGISDEKGKKMHFIEADYNFIPTMGMELAAGRNFSDRLLSDNANSVIINETAAREFGWKNALGKTISQNIETSDGEISLTRTVIGVVKDFHQTSLYHKIEPQLIGNRLDQRSRVIAKISSSNISGTLHLLENKWNELVPDQPFDFYFLDESFNSQYRADERLGRIILNFAVLAIIIACLGLLGISVYSAQRRTKEIGIRKVLGATEMGILKLLTRRFLVLIVIANIFAWPLAYYAANKWLQNFAYRIEINWIVFAFSAVIALVIALLTISYHALHAARANPVETLRYE